MKSKTNKKVAGTHTGTVAKKVTQKNKVQKRTVKVAEKVISRIGINPIEDFMNLATFSEIEKRGISKDGEWVDMSYYFLPKNILKNRIGEVIPLFTFWKIAGTLKNKEIDIKDFYPIEKGGYNKMGTWFELSYCFPDQKIEKHYQFVEQVVTMFQKNCSDFTQLKSLDKETIRWCKYLIDFTKDFKRHLSKRNFKEIEKDIELDLI